MLKSPPPKTSGRLVLALQFWAGDKAAAMRNARRIADNEKIFRRDVEFVFVARFDCAHDDETVAYVAKKFRTSKWTSTRKGTGWPAGCNDVWCDLMCQHAMRSLYSGAWADVKAIFTLEGDCIPVVSDWIDQISAEWDCAATQGKFVVGCFMPPPLCGPIGHINGNALFPPDLFARVPQVIGCSPHNGWDAMFAVFFEPHWFKTPLITNYYKSLSVTERDFRRVAADGRIPALIHGVKDLSCENFADRILFGPQVRVLPPTLSPKPVTSEPIQPNIPVRPQAGSESLL